MTNSANGRQSILPSALIQVAYRVPDLEAACYQWASSVGAGPFLLRHHQPVTATYNGAPATYDHSAAFGQWGPLMLELIEVHECGPEPMREVIEHDAPGQVNHFACYADDLEATSATLEEAGYPLTMALISSSGMQVHYHDARPLIGAVLEVFPGGQHIKDHFANIASRAIDWDGSNVISYMN